MIIWLFQLLEQAEARRRMQGDQNNWVISVNDELNRLAENSMDKEREQWKKPSIYKVPIAVTDLNKKAYRPQTVSFGPYHHGEGPLKPMEEHKQRALLHFLKRSKKPLQLYVNSLAEVVQQLKDSYDCLDKAWQENTDEFLQLMILDGCFMLEILRAAATLRMADNDPIFSYVHGKVADYADNDPIFSAHGDLYIMPYIKRDMLMLENQLPMLVLSRLLAVQDEKAMEHEELVNVLILNFCSLTKNKLGKCLHVLDVYRKSLLWGETPKKSRKTHKFVNVKNWSICSSSSSGDEDHDIIRSASELNEAGIRFGKSESVSLKDISFHGGKLRLPSIVVDDVTETLFLNLIAFERYHVGIGNEVTSYIFFMDSLIDTVRDVIHLNSKGIIQNAIGSDKAVTNLFNTLSKDVTPDPNGSLNEVHKEVTNYCSKRLHKWRANLLHTYFTNPWAILSVIAAIFLFALTIVQTIYSVLGYYHA
ncbi:UPF0481 protein At3g47200-like [Cornus florida]|uniref:UPF0481 protein At3g47200-like n=1 Tax=Cornus florida TaxID=4283 RepID=UPI00289D1542|nr:UPF0481 protein At3g47200-like [Cornus florida]